MHLEKSRFVVECGELVGLMLYYIFSYLAERIAMGSISSGGLFEYFVRLGDCFVMAGIEASRVHCPQL